MASAVYPEALEAILSAGVNLTSADIRAVFIDTADYTYSAAHDFLDDVAAGSRVGTPVALASKTVSGGTFDAADTTLTSVTGDPVEAIILFVHTGSDATARLIAYIDGISVTPNGGNIQITWNASGILVFG